jgi:hypothetical protein
VNFEQPDKPEEREELEPFGSAREESGPTDPAESVSAQGLRIVYEDELRRVCHKRALSPEEEKKWLAIRRTLPINLWINRSLTDKLGKGKLKDLKKEIERYLAIFTEEAGRHPFDLDMDRNYYRAAINLLGRYDPGTVPGEKDQNLLTGLMVMVDYKDAKLALQILESIV